MFHKLLEKLVRPLVAQLMDLRSAVTKEASNAVRVMVQSLENDFRPLAAKFMHSNALFKLVACATKIIMEHGHVCCLAIINYSQEPKVIENIFENLTTKNSTLRAKLAMYIYIILGCWPEYILEKYLGTLDTGSFKNKNKLGVDTKPNRGGTSKQRTGMENRVPGGSTLKGADSPQNFEDFFKILLGDASPDCRYYARQCFLTFHEIWPDEAEPLILQHKGVLMKDKEVVEKLGPYLESAGAQSSSAKIKMTSKELARTDKSRKTHKVPKGGDSRGFLSPGGNRRADATPKSQNRVKSNTKFLSEEREKPPHEEAANKQATLSTGFRNLRPGGYNNIKEEKDVYVSKYQRPIESDYKKRSVSKDVIGTYKSTGIGLQNKNGFNGNQKMVHEDDLMELDEKCQDISEIEIDPEDNKEVTLYPTPYQGYNAASKSTPEQEITDLLKKADSSKWNDRIVAFEQLANYISNKASSLPNVSMFCKIVNLHFDHLDDPHFKVILVVHKSFGKLIHSFGETLEPYLSEIIPRLLINLSDKREKVNNSANILLNLL